MQSISSLQVIPVANTDSNQYFLEMQPATGQITGSLYANKSLRYTPSNKTLYVDNLSYAANGLPWQIATTSGNTGGGVSSGGVPSIGWPLNTLFVSNSLGIITTANNLTYVANGNTGNLIINSGNIIAGNGGLVLVGGNVTISTTNSAIIMPDNTVFRSANTTATVNIIGPVYTGGLAVGGTYYFTNYSPKPLTINYVSAYMNYPANSGFTNVTTFSIQVNGVNVPGLTGLQANTLSSLFAIPSGAAPIAVGQNVSLLLSSSNLFGTTNSFVCTLGMS
jgi:fructose-specific component phosphotransferase system IIB-like protein